jgi:signal transduction histidine kinase
MTLRRVLSVVFTTLVVLLVATSGALIVATTRLDRTAGALTDGIESLKLGYGIELALVSHDRAVNGFGRATSEAVLRQLLAEAAGHVGSQREGDLLDETSRRVEAYLVSSEQDPRRPELFERALGRVEELVQLNLGQSAAERANAEKWNRWANAYGATTVAVSLLGLVVILLWLRMTMFRPAIHLAGAVRQLASGDKRARAPEEGAHEFRSIARHFNQMADDLAQQEKNRLAFLAGVAHDLRNPLGALKMASAIIPPDKPLPPEDQIRQTLGRVQRQIDRLERMVWDLLDASRIEAGILDVRPERCDLREITGAVVDLFRPGAPSHEFVLSLPNEPALCRCDPGRMEQVLTNLVSNAVKYSPKGGRVELRIAHQASRVRVSVSDQGIGIAPDDLKQLFEPFRRRGTSNESISGVGLGLFVTRRIVEAHGGSIEIESSPRRGSTFHVVLPAGEELEAPATAVDSEPAQPRALH